MIHADFLTARITQGLIDLGRAVLLPTAWRGAPGVDEALISGGRAKNGVTCSRGRHQSGVMALYFFPHRPVSKSLSASSAASPIGAW